MLFGARCKCGSRSFIRLPRGPMKCTDCGVLRWGPVRRKPQFRIHPFLVVTLISAVAIGGGLAWTPNTLNVSETEASPALTGVVSVVDGDTIDMHGRRIRLYGLDAP